MSDIEIYKLYSHDFYGINHNGEEFIWEVKVLNLSGTDNYIAKVTQDELGVKTKWNVVRIEYLVLDTQLMIRKEIANLK